MQASVAPLRDLPTTAHRGTCGECSEVVVLARLPNGIAVILDFEESVPTMPCPLCKQVISRGHQLTGWCWRCGGTKMIGGPLPQPGVALNPDGRARIYKGRKPKPGEAIHALHACDPAAALRAA